MSQIHLPDEITEIILKSIKNTEIILNCRLVCRKWYNFLKNVDVYLNNHKIGENKFFENKFQLFDTQGNIQKEIVFKKYGKTIYKEYKENGYVKKMITIEAPFKTKIMDYTNDYLIENIVYDSYKKKEIKKSYPLLHNNQCIIS